MQLETYAKPIVRLGVSLVFLWFGINQLIDAEYFLSYLPDFLLTSSNPYLYVYINGIFELLLGLALALGFFVRPVAAVLALHLLGITLSLGYNEIAVRDLGLTLATLGVFFGGKDKWCLQK